MLLDTLFEDSVGLIKKWRPKSGCSKETEYRNDLLEYLRDGLNSSSPFTIGNVRRVSVVPEHGRGLCDIGVDRKVGIELKNNLSGKSKVDRLIGQVNGYKREYEDIVIVLVGETDKNALEYLKDQLDSMSSAANFVFTESRIKIIDKGKKAKSRKAPQKTKSTSKSVKKKHKKTKKK